jgi:ABC-2 type transport system permease protein
MNGITAIIRKELADHFSSYRFIILFALIAMVSLIITHMVGTNLRKELDSAVSIGSPGLQFVFLRVFTSTGPLSLVQFVAFFGPLIGLVLGFDSINRERSSGTLSKLASQPIYRDAIINGKFLSGVATIAIMVTSIVLVVSGLGITLIGVEPGIEELWRIVVYLIISIFYISFWLGISILFSILFRGIATSALATLAFWIFFLLFGAVGPSVVANSLVPLETEESPERFMKHLRVQQIVSLVSPIQLYNESTAIIIDPMRKTTRSHVLMGHIERLSSARFRRPLALSQSIYVVLPHMITLIAITFICFGVSYAVFMKQEIRST